VEGEADGPCLMKERRGGYEHYRLGEHGSLGTCGYCHSYTGNGHGTERKVSCGV